MTNCNTAPGQRDANKPCSRQGWCTITDLDAWLRSSRIALEHALEVAKKAESLQGSDAALKSIAVELLVEFQRANDVTSEIGARLATYGVMYNVASNVTADVNRLVKAQESLCSLTDSVQSYLGNAAVPDPDSWEKFQEDRESWFAQVKRTFSSFDPQGQVVTIGTVALAAVLGVAIFSAVTAKGKGARRR